MRSNNRITQRKILLVVTGILAALLVILLLVALWLGSAEDPSVPVDGPSGTTVPSQSQEVAEPEKTKPPGMAATYPDDTQHQVPTDPVTTEPAPTNPAPTQPPHRDDPPPQTEPPVEDIPLEVKRVARFSGQFVEDGSDALVEHVAAILVTNPSDRFLDLATVTYDIEGKTATFVVTGLPAGRSAWVMEQGAMSIAKDVQTNYLGCVTTYRDGVSATADEITIRSEGNMLTAVNNTDRTLDNVFIYYKTLHSDGNFFGGITYLVDFGTLAPGGSAQSIAGHFQEGKTEIVRIGWQERRS